MNAFGKVASFFHANHPRERKLTLNINLDLEGKGAGRMVAVDFMVDWRGRARLLADKELPREITKKYGDTLLAAVVSVTGWEVVKTGQGLRLRSPDGIVEYEFIIALKDGTTGIPYRVRPWTGRREYGDLRNYGISDYLEGATINIKINSVNCDLKNSELKEIKRKVRRFEIYNLDGSETVVYRAQAPPAIEKALYQEYESYRKLSMVRHLLPGKQPVFPKFSYSAFDSPERTTWLPGMPSQASQGESSRRAFPMPKMGKAGTAVFGNGFEVIADVLPDAQASLQLVENTFPQADEQQITGENPPGCIAYARARMECGNPQVIGIGQLQMNGRITALAKQQGIKHNMGVLAQNGKKEKNKKGAVANEETPSRIRSFKPVPFSALSSFKAVIFDLDGVIVDSEMVHPRTFERALAEYGIKIENSHWKRAYTGIGSYAIFEDIVKKHKIKEDARELVKKRNEIYLAEIKRNRLPVMEGFPEVHRLLEESGVKEAVASGGHTNHVEESLRSAGLRHVPFVSIEMVKRGKPAPEIFLKAAKRLRVKPSECIVFEDSLSGTEAAAAAEMPCVALSTTMPEGELRARAALVVRNFRSKKLAKLLTVLLARNGKPSAKGKGRKAAPARRTSRWKGK